MAFLPAVRLVQYTSYCTGSLPPLLLPLLLRLVVPLQALLYLVPCTLGVVLSMAVARGELHLLLDAALDGQDDAIDVDATDGAAGPDDGDRNTEGGQQRARSGSAAAAGGWHAVGSAHDGIAEQRVALLAGQQGSSSGDGGCCPHGDQRLQQPLSQQGPGPVQKV